jgi:AcrR family transcriptional regulator
MSGPSNDAKENMGRISDAKERLMNAVGELIWTGSYGSTTIDQICEKAGVKKGSFYYFFDSKADLAVTAIDADWAKRRVELDSLFSPTVPPLERLRQHCCEYGYRLQAEIKNRCGCVLGCPLFSLGSEVSTKNSNCRRKSKKSWIKSGSISNRDPRRTCRGSFMRPTPPQKRECFMPIIKASLPRPAYRMILKSSARPSRGFTNCLE